MDYIAQHSGGQVTWMVCDANFGILPRDVEIAERLRGIMSAYGNPLSVVFWSPKNTSARNIRIAQLLGRNQGGYVAIQSADPVVLKNSGRGAISMRSLVAQIEHFHSEKLPVATDLLIGLPSETSASHLQSIVEAFDMGFDQIQPYNIRMLPGSVYETEDYRKQYGVWTKFRPIFGAYGVYNGVPVLEMEESVRATSTMTESELNAFKVHHWLLHFAWNSGVFKPLLQLGRRHGINPGLVIDQVANTTTPILRTLFDDLLTESMNEWFPTEQEFLGYYAEPDNFRKLEAGFVKLNMRYIAIVHSNSELMHALGWDITRILREQLAFGNDAAAVPIEEMNQFCGLLICQDLLSPPYSNAFVCSGTTAAVILNDEQLSSREMVSLEIFRSPEDAAFCRFHLQRDGYTDLSIQNLTRFIEIGGLDLLKNRVSLVSGATTMADSY